MMHDRSLDYCYGEQYHPENYWLDAESNHNADGRHNVMHQAYKTSQLLHLLVSYTVTIVSLNTQ